VSYPESTPGQTRWCALIFAIIFFFPALGEGLLLVKAERTGVIPYQTSRLPATYTVSRVESPDKFNQSVAYTGYHLALFGGVSAVSFWFYRKLSE